MCLVDGVLECLVGACGAGEVVQGVPVVVDVESEDGVGVFAVQCSADLSQAGDVFWECGFSQESVAAPGLVVLVGVCHREKSAELVGVFDGFEEAFLAQDFDLDGGVLVHDVAFFVAA